MNKKNIITSILLVIILLVLLGTIYQYKKNNKSVNNNTVTDNNYIEHYEEDKQYDCKFTRTYRVVNLLDNYIAEVPEWSYVILDQYQRHIAISHKIPTELKKQLITNKYYEFTYTIKNTGKIETIEDINEYLVLDTDTIGIKLEIKETDKTGLEQIQEDICLSK